MQPIRQCPTCGQVIKTRMMSVFDILEERIDLVLDHAEENPDFDITFIEGLKQQLQEWGKLSPKQIAALNSIIDKLGLE